MSYKPAYDSVHMYMCEVTSRVVAAAGIPSDRHHLGKIILHSLQSDPDFDMQIDGATGASETSGSALRRSVRCALALRRRGAQRGDVLALLGPNHLDLCVPHYAALYLGLTVAAVDCTLVVKSLTNSKHLKGGVIFMKEFSLTSKINRKKLWDTVLTMKRE